MISANNSLRGKITAEQNLSAKLNNKEIHIYPELEELTVMPSTEEQHFQSEKYGFSNVTVLGIDVSGIIDEKNIAIDNILIESDTGNLQIAYNDNVLALDFSLEDKELIVNNNSEGLDFNINENMELEAIY